MDELQQRAAILVALAVVPSLLYLYLARNMERHNREPVRTLLLEYGYGATFGVGLALILNTSGQIAQIGLWNVGTEFATLIVAMAIAPFFEEFAKAIGLYIGRRELDEPEDGLIHGAAIGLGFGATENLVYGFMVFDDGQLAFQTLIARSFTSMLLHAGSTALVGYGLSRSGRATGRAGRVFAMYLVAVAVHATYNALVIAPSAFGAPDSMVGYAFLGALVLVFYLVVWVRRRIRLHDQGIG